MLDTIGGYLGIVFRNYEKTIKRTMNYMILVQGINFMIQVSELF